MELGPPPKSALAQLSVKLDTMRKTNDCAAMKSEFDNFLGCSPANTSVNACARDQGCYSQSVMGPGEYTLVASLCKGVDSDGNIISAAPPPKRRKTDPQHGLPNLHHELVGLGSGLLGLTSVDGFHTWGIRWRERLSLIRQQKAAQNASM